MADLRQARRVRIEVSDDEEGCRVFKEWRRRRQLAMRERIAAEREAARRSARTPIERLDPLIRELVEIGAEVDYLVSDRAREIGVILDARGGLSEMQDAYHELINWHNENARGLSRAWNGIGHWQA
ncbi:hypothetical protein [Microlunatus speluncae]|uniref:hypothetical protein n=1 Tax=Microlunatus speluncae TaxID=2594267 RepID=UPI0012665C59|nr:hypothetical protein [Microlunatus speluncae]